MLKSVFHFEEPGPSYCSKGYKRYEEKLKFLGLKNQTLLFECIFYLLDFF